MHVGNWLDRLFPWWNDPGRESPGQAAKTRALIFVGPVVLVSVVVGAFTRTDSPPLAVIFVGVPIAWILMICERRRRSQNVGDES